MVFVLVAKYPLILRAPDLYRKLRIFMGLILQEVMENGIVGPPLWKPAILQDTIVMLLVFNQPNTSPSAFEAICHEDWTDKREDGLDRVVQCHLLVMVIPYLHISNPAIIPKPKERFGSAYRYIPYIKQMSCVALPLFGLPPVCPRVHSLGYVGDAKLVERMPCGRVSYICRYVLKWRPGPFLCCSLYSLSWTPPFQCFGTNGLASYRRLD